MQSEVGNAILVQDTRRRNHPRAQPIDAHASFHQRHEILLALRAAHRPFLLFYFLFYRFFLSMIITIIIIIMIIIIMIMIIIMVTINYYHHHHHHHNKFITIKYRPCSLQQPPTAPDTARNTLNAPATASALKAAKNALEAPARVQLEGAAHTVINGNAR